MGPAAAVILLAVLLAILVVIWGAVSKRRSIAVALVALSVAGLAALGSYYAAVESQSVPWALGYGAVGLFSAAVAGRHLHGKLSKSAG